MERVGKIRSHLETCVRANNSILVASKCTSVDSDDRDNDDEKWKWHISKGDLVVLDRNRGVAEVVQVHTDNLPDEIYYTVKLIESEPPNRELQTTPGHILAKVDFIPDQSINEN